MRDLGEVVTIVVPWNVSNDTCKAVHKILLQDAHGYHVYAGQGAYVDDDGTLHAEDIDILRIAGLSLRGLIDCLNLLAAEQDSVYFEIRGRGKLYQNGDNWHGEM